MPRSSILLAQPGRDDPAGHVESEHEAVKAALRAAHPDAGAEAIELMSLMMEEQKKKKWATEKEEKRLSYNDFRRKSVHRAVFKLVRPTPFVGAAIDTATIARMRTAQPDEYRRYHEAIIVARQHEDAATADAHMETAVMQAMQKEDAAAEEGKRWADTVAKHEVHTSRQRRRGANASMDDRVSKAKERKREQDEARFQKGIENVSSTTQRTEAAAELRQMTHEQKRASDDESARELRMEACRALQSSREEATFITALQRHARATERVEREQHARSARIAERLATEDLRRKKAELRKKDVAEKRLRTVLAREKQRENAFEHRIETVQTARILRFQSLEEQEKRVHDRIQKVTNERADQIVVKLLSPSTAPLTLPGKALTSPSASPLTPRQCKAAVIPFSQHSQRQPHAPPLPSLPGAQSPKALKRHAQEEAAWAKAAELEDTKAQDRMVELHRTSQAIAAASDFRCKRIRQSADRVGAVTRKNVADAQRRAERIAQEAEEKLLKKIEEEDAVARGGAGAPQDVRNDGLFWDAILTRLRRRSMRAGSPPSKHLQKSAAEWSTLPLLSDPTSTPPQLPPNGADLSGPATERVLSAHPPEPAQHFLLPLEAHSCDPQAINEKSQSQVEAAQARKDIFLKNASSAKKARAAKRAARVERRYSVMVEKQLEDKLQSVEALRVKIDEHVKRAEAAKRSSITQLQPAVASAR